jgi:Tol biopolymer transport system component
METYHGTIIAFLFMVFAGMNCVDDSLPITSPRNPTDAAAGTLAKKGTGNGRIAFASDRGSSCFNIYVMTSDGNEVTALTAGSPPECSRRPDWSPDGKEITFTAVLADHIDVGSQIYVMKADGSGKTRLSTSGSAEGSRWSPDGRKILFGMWFQETYQVYVMSADGTHVSQVTHDENYAYNPSWAPDSRRILYTSGNDGQIHVIDVDGRHDRVLTHDPRLAENPAWSPNGDKIAFTSFRDNPPDVWENAEIYLINPDGSGCKRLTHNPAVDAQPCWSDDGTRILFVSMRSGNYEVYSMNAGGGDQRRVTDNPAFDTDPTWAR